MQILGFSPRVYEEARRFFKEHPVVEIKVLRAADMSSPCVPLGNGVCDKCGDRIILGRVFADALADNLKAMGEEMPRGQLPSDYLQAREVRHCWDQASRSRYCGGVIEFAVRE